MILFWLLLLVVIVVLLMLGFGLYVALVFSYYLEFVCYSLGCDFAWV